MEGNANSSVRFKLDFLSILSQAQSREMHINNETPNRKTNEQFRRILTSENKTKKMLCFHIIGCNQQQ